MRKLAMDQLDRVDGGISLNSALAHSTTTSVSAPDPTGFGGNGGGFPFGGGGFPFPGGGFGGIGHLLHDPAIGGAVNQLLNDPTFTAAIDQFTAAHPELSAPLGTIVNALEQRTDPAHATQPGAFHPGAFGPPPGLFGPHGFVPPPGVLGSQGFVPPPGILGPQGLVPPPAPFAPFAPHGPVPFNLGAIPGGAVAAGTLPDATQAPLGPLAGLPGTSSITLPDGGNATYNLSVTGPGSYSYSYSYSGPGPAPAGAPIAPVVDPAATTTAGATPTV